MFESDDSKSREIEVERPSHARVVNVGMNGDDVKVPKTQVSASWQVFMSKLNQTGGCVVCWDVTVQGRADRTFIDSQFESLYRRELRVLNALGATLTGSREAGADLAHEAWLRAFRAWPTVGALERPGGWVRRVLINLAIDAHRRGAREHVAVQRVERPGFVETGSPLDGPFWVAVRALPERQRVAVALRYLDDLSVDDIADVMQVTAGTVKSSLFAAKKSLARTLGAQEADDDDHR